jgi:phosphoserine phosphatase
MNEYSTILLDFDGTLTRQDLLDHLAQTKGKGYESKQLWEEFQLGKIDGKTCLRERIRLLKGCRIEEIHQLLSKDLLCPGFDAFRSWVTNRRIRVVLISGNICPVLHYYKDVFAASKTFCTELIVENDYVVDMLPDGIGKNLKRVKKYLAKVGVPAENAIAVGDDVSDIPFFDFAGWSIAFNSREDVVSHARQAVNGDLYQLVSALDAIIPRSQRV